MKFKKGDIVKVKEEVYGLIEKNAIGRVIDSAGLKYMVEPIEGYEDKFLKGESRFLHEGELELYGGGKE